MNTAPATPSMAPSAEAAQSDLRPAPPRGPAGLQARGRHRRRSDGRAYRRGFPGIRELIRDLSEKIRANASLRRRLCRNISARRGIP